jgi:hypothetical protein
MSSSWRNCFATVPREAYFFPFFLAPSKRFLHVLQVQRLHIGISWFASNVESDGWPEISSRSLFDVASLTPGSSADDDETYLS